MATLWSGRGPAVACLGARLVGAGRSRGLGRGQLRGTSRGGGLGSPLALAPPQIAGDPDRDLQPPVHQHHERARQPRGTRWAQTTIDLGKPGSKPYVVCDGGGLPQPWPSPPPTSMTPSWLRRSWTT